MAEGKVLKFTAPMVEVANDFGGAVKTSDVASAPKDGIEVEFKRIENWDGIGQKPIDKVLDFLRTDDNGSRMVLDNARQETLFTRQLDKPGKPLAKENVSLRFRYGTILKNIELCLKWNVVDPMDASRTERYECCVGMESDDLPPDFEALKAKYNPANDPTKHPKVYEALCAKIAEIEAIPGDFATSYDIKAERRSYIVTLNDMDRKTLGLVHAEDVAEEDKKTIFIELIHDTVSYWDEKAKKWCAEHDELEDEVLTKQDEFIDADGRFIARNLTTQNVCDIQKHFQSLVASVAGSGLETTLRSKSERAHVFACHMESARMKYPNMPAPAKLTLAMIEAPVDAFLQACDDAMPAQNEPAADWAGLARRIDLI
ncbi:MAG: hypothetical protein GC136_08650 [Alphaproteobacteria bacterium]|nr:hypothetical protein [Alphaproteobacteria bacterium]